MNIFDAIIQGIVQGLTEFLPVSSSGHLTLVQHFFGINGEAALLLSVVLHLGTLLAVFIAYYKTIFDLIREFISTVRDIFTGKFSFKNMSENRRFMMMVILATAPLIIFYFFKDPIKAISSDNSILLEGVFFLYTGTILFLSEHVRRGKKGPGDIKAKDAIITGIFQGIALLPGVSRSGSTIAGARFCGIKRSTAVRYSFILSIPPILAGSLVEAVDCIKAEELVIDIPALIVGFLTAAIVGFIAIQLVKWLVRTNHFKVFAYYTFALGIIVIIISLVELIIGSPAVAVAAAVA